MRRFNKPLTVILALAILGTLGILGYIVANSREERFTEFHILDLDGKAINYPDELMVGEKGEVLVGIVNRERETTIYRVEIAMDGARNGETGIVILEDSEKWEKAMSFTPIKVGDNQKAEFLLYKKGEAGVYSRLHLWVDVKN